MTFRDEMQTGGIGAEPGQPEGGRVLPAKDVGTEPGQLESGSVPPAEGIGAEPGQPEGGRVLPAEDIGAEPGQPESGSMPPARVVPKITKKEDVPFPSSLTANGLKGPKIDSNLSQIDSLDKEITRFRYRTGRQVLFVAMTLMCIAVGADLFASAFGLENNLISSAFEAFKLITMTVLGYIFGSSGGKSN